MVSIQRRPWTTAIPEEIEIIIAFLVFYESGCLERHLMAKHNVNVETLVSLRSSQLIRAETRVFHIHKDAIKNALLMRALLCENINY